MSEPSPLDHPLVFGTGLSSAAPDRGADRLDFRGAVPARLLVRTVDPRAGWVLYFHGNGELAAECDRHLADLFTDLGGQCLLCGVPGLWGLGGQTPTLTGMLADGEQIVRAVGVPADRIVAFGRSLGSVYAIELARRLPDLAEPCPGERHRRAVGALAARGPDAADRTDCGGPGRGPGPRLRSRAKAGRVQGASPRPAFRGDVLVEPWHARKLHAWAGGARKRLALLPHGNHNSILFANAAAYVSNCGRSSPSADCRRIPRPAAQRAESDGATASEVRPSSLSRRGNPGKAGRSGSAQEKRRPSDRSP